MRNVIAAAMLLLAMAIPASAAKLKGSTVLKNSEPTGTIDKDHKHQMYDLSFAATDKLYTCRTDPGKSMNATDFVVGSDVNYEVDGKKAKIRTREGKEVKCKVVRVEADSTLR